MQYYRTQSKPRKYGVELIYEMDIQDVLEMVGLGLGVVEVMVTVALVSVGGEVKIVDVAL